MSWHLLSCVARRLLVKAQLMGAERQQNQPLFLTVKEAASILRISDWTLWALVRAPKNSGIPIKRVGRSIRFPTKRFLKWAGEE